MTLHQRVILLVSMRRMSILYNVLSDFISCQTLCLLLVAPLAAAKVEGAEDILGGDRVIRWSC